MKKKLSLAVLLIFFFQIGYISYRLPQAIILGEKIPDGVKLAAAIAGISIGVMFLLKDYSSPLQKLEFEDNAEEDEPERESNEKT